MPELSDFLEAAPENLAERSGEKPATQEAQRGHVRKLKRMLFDLAYLVVNADGGEHLSEQLIMRELQGRVEVEKSVDAEARKEALAPVLQAGPVAIRERALRVASEVVREAGDAAAPLTEGYRDLLSRLIVADAHVSEAERALFDGLCDYWDLDNPLTDTA
jgi:uncharacterized tellurite resistance protein B-like protein